MQTVSRSASTSAPRPLIWERDEPEPRAALLPVRRDDVVRAAIELADTHGLEAVSVRRVAAALGVGPMRLYRVFDTVDELTELMMDAVYGEVVERVQVRGAWRARVRAILTETRAVVLEHEWVADLLGSRPQLGPHGLAWLELLSNALGRAPAVTGAAAGWAALGAVNGFQVGALRREVADRRASRVNGGTPEWQRRTAPYVARMLDTGDFPTMRELILARVQPDPDVVFRAELDILLAGLAGR